MQIKFLTRWQIDLDKVPTYPEFNQDFTEQVDYTLAKMILNHNDTRLTDEIKAEFNKLVNCIDPTTSMLSVRYHPRYKIGRRYADCPSPTLPNGLPNPLHGKYYSALIAQPRIIKNTIFKYQGWIDLDQVKGHPTLLSCVAEGNGVELEAYEEYLAPGNFDRLVAEMSAYYTVPGETDIIDKKDIKWLFNKTIYGGGHKQWVEDLKKGSYKDHNGVEICKRKPKKIRNEDKKHPFYQRFYWDTKRLINHVYTNNEAVKKLVCADIVGGEEMEWKRRNRVMSYFCGVVEHEITYRAYQYLTKNNIIQRRYCDWALDGVTIPAPSGDIDFDDHIVKMNEYVRAKTGLSRVAFVRKDFDDGELLHALLEARPNAVVACAAADGVTTFSQMAAEFEKTHCKIINRSIFIKEAEGQCVAMSRQQIKTSYEHMVFNEVIKGSSVETNFIDRWMRNNSSQRCYDNIDVYPNRSLCPSNTFNLWQPFAMELVAEYTPNEAALQVFLKHLLILCGNNVPIYEYFIKWIAQMIQFPEVKSICPTLISSQGAGKNTLIVALKKMLGCAKVLENSDPSRDIWGSFNPLMANAFLVNLNELSKRDTMEAEGKIKALITDPKLSINEKGVNAYEISSYHRFIITTNSYEPVTTSSDDRRNLIIRSSDEMCGNQEYFNNLYRLLDDVNVVKTMYEYFKNVEGVDRFRDIPIPVSEHQSNLRELSVSPIEQWVKDFTLANSDKESVELLGSAAYEYFKQWCEVNGVKYEINSKTFGVRLSNLKITGIEKGRHTNKGETRLYNIPALKKQYGLGALIEYTAK